MPPHLLSHPWHEVEVCRRKEVSKAEVIMVPFFDKRADTVWNVLARDRFVCSGIHVVNRTRSSSSHMHLHGSRAQGVVARVFEKKKKKRALIHLSSRHHVSDRSLSLRALTSSSLSSVSTFLSILFTSSILVIILHVVGTSEYKNPGAHAEWGVWSCGITQPSYTLTGRHCNKFRCSSCSLIGLSCCGTVYALAGIIAFGVVRIEDRVVWWGWLGDQDLLPPVLLRETCRNDQNLAAKACRSPLLVSFPHCRVATYEWCCFRSSFKCFRNSSVHPMFICELL